MKILFVSDIHGSGYYLEQLIDKLDVINPDKIVILGDILYHGPRNPMPVGYDCKKVIRLLNERKDMITAVRGNCDSEVDQMVLEFSITKDYQTLDVDGHHFFLTHGHVYGPDNTPKLNQGDILAYGHFHKPVAKKEGDIYMINPSSLSLAKEGSNSYGVYEDHVFKIYDLKDNLVKEILFD